MSASVPTCVCVHSSIIVRHGFSFVYRWIYSHDSSLPSKEENRLLCDPDIPALHHDSHPLPGLLLAQSRVGASQDCLWWVFCVDYSDSSPFYVTEKGNSIHPTQTRHYGQEASLTFLTLPSYSPGLMSNIAVLWMVHFDVKKMRKYWTFLFYVCDCSLWETAKQYKEKNWCVVLSSVLMQLSAIRFCCTHIAFIAFSNEKNNKINNYLTIMRSWSLKKKKLCNYVIVTLQSCLYILANHDGRWWHHCS